MAASTYNSHIWETEARGLAGSEANLDYIESTRPAREGYIARPCLKKIKPSCQPANLPVVICSVSVILATNEIVGSIR